MSETKSTDAHRIPASGFSYNRFGGDIQMHLIEAETVARGESSSPSPRRSEIGNPRDPYPTGGVKQLD